MLNNQGMGRRQEKAVANDNELYDAISRIVESKNFELGRGTDSFVDDLKRCLWDVAKLMKSRRGEDYEAEYDVVHGPERVPGDPKTVARHISVSDLNVLAKLGWEVVSVEWFDGQMKTVLVRRRRST